MKKRLSLLLAALLLTGCSTSPLPPTGPSAAPAGEAPETAAPTEAVYDDSLISEIHQQPQFLPEGWEEPIQCDFRLPQLLQDTEDAQNINSIVFSAIPQSAGVPTYDQGSWESHWNGSLLSLIVKLRYTYTSEYDYAVFNYDCAAGKLIADSQLLRQQGLEKKDAEKLLRKAAARRFDQDCLNWPRESQLEMPELRAQTLSWQNLNPDTTPFYLDDQGRLCSLTALSIPAGGGRYTESLVLSDFPPCIQKSVDDGYVLAELKNDDLTLTYQSDTQESWNLGQDLIPHDIPLPVRGVYGHYQDIAIGNVAWEFWPMVLLLDDAGRITFCDLMLPSETSMGPTAVGPLPEPSGLTGFTFQETPYGGQQLMGLRGQEVVDIHPYLYEAAGAVPAYLLDHTFVTEDASGGLVFDPENNNYDFLWQSHHENIGGGLVFYLGMDGGGMHYLYSMGAERTDVHGLLRLEVFPETYEGSRRLVIENHTNRSVSGLPAHMETPLFPYYP